MRNGAFPRWLKAGWALYAMAIIAIYAVRIGPLHLLWFSDLALIASVAALGLEIRLLASMLAIAVLVPEILWNVGFFYRAITGSTFLDIAGYMFDPENPLLLRGLSLFHVPLPLLLVVLVARLGYERRALPLQVIVGPAVLLLTFALTDPSQNINWVHGIPGIHPEPTHPRLYLAGLLVAVPAVFYVPAHLLLDRLFGTARNEGVSASRR